MRKEVQSQLSILITLLCFYYAASQPYTEPQHYRNWGPSSRPVYQPPSPPRSPPPVTYCPTKHCPEAKCPPPSPPPNVTANLTCNCNCNQGNPHKPPKEREDKCKWHLVFKAVKGKRKVWKDFTGSGTINPNSAEAMVISSNTMPFKSQKMNEWNQMVIKQVKVDVFNEGERKAWFLFDGTASTRTNWFSQDRLIASPYSDLKTGKFTFFSAEGKKSDQIRFFINKQDGRCKGDCGYLAVVDKKKSDCSWKNIKDAPYFLYSPKKDDCCNWKDAATKEGSNQKDKIADVFAVSIKTCELDW